MSPAKFGYPIAILLVATSSAKLFAVTFVDGTMNPHDYDVLYQTSNRATVTTSHATGYGYPPSSLQLDFASTQNGATSAHTVLTNPRFSYNPSLQGEISRINVALDLYTADSGFAVLNNGYSIVAAQDGHLYEFSGELPTTTDVWHRGAANGLSAADFRPSSSVPWMTDGPGLDFGSTGSQIVFGVQGGWDSTSHYTAKNRLDNFMVEIERALEPSTILGLDPKATYLKPTTPSDLANLHVVQDAKKINLASGLPFSVQPGDWLQLHAVGDFKFTQHPLPPDPGPYGDATLREIFGVFSNSDELKPETFANRVPGAVEIKDGTFGPVVSAPADIDHDFWIPSQSMDAQGAIVRVPVGATHLFLGAADLQWFDNSSDYFGVKITKLHPGQFQGDFNGDGDVNGRDFLMWQRGQTLDPLGPAVLTKWKTHYGGLLPNLAIAYVPEPASCTGIILAGVFVWGTRHRRGIG